MNRLARRLTPLLATLAALSGPPIALAQTLPAPQNVLLLVADASTEVVQDTLTIALQATQEGPDAAAVQSQLRRVLDAVLVEARKAVRPGQLDLRTGQFSVYPRYATKPGGSSGIVGWQGRAELLIEGRDVAAVSQLAGRLGQVATPGGQVGMTVSRVAFSLSREAREVAEAEVATQAINRFKLRAESYARQFGFGAYSLREVSVAGSDMALPVGQPMMRAMRAGVSAGADELQPVEAGKATVTVSVSGSIQLSAR
jgi:predicted secreted protein